MLEEGAEVLLVSVWTCLPLALGTSPWSSGKPTESAAGQEMPGCPSAAGPGHWAVLVVTVRILLAEFVVVFVYLKCVPKCEGLGSPLCSKRCAKEDVGQSGS